MRRIVPTLFAALLLLLTGCGWFGGGPTPTTSVSTPTFDVVISDPTTSTPTTKIAANPFNQLVAILPQGKCGVTGDLEGQFAASQMQTYLQCIVPDVDAWIDVAYDGMRHPKGYYLVPRGVSFNDNGCPIDPTSLQYCTNNESIFLGQDSVWDQYINHGDASVPVILAHEETHHFQHVMGMAIGQAGLAQVPFENQGDCGAGAFMAHARNNGQMSANDIRDLSGSLEAAAGVEGDAKRDHGTISQRIGSFNQSYTSTLRNPLVACNNIVAGVVLVPVR